MGLEMRREYGFDKLAKGSVKKIVIPPKDPIAGSRALTAAYAFARRHNAKNRRKIRFAGRLSKNKKVMHIHRVQ